MIIKTRYGVLILPICANLMDDSDITAPLLICLIDQLLHSDQGQQFASWEFVLFCKEQGITQSMSKAGCPYDNAAMERFFNTFKSLDKTSVSIQSSASKGLKYFPFAICNPALMHEP